MVFASCTSVLSERGEKERMSKQKKEVDLLCFTDPLGQRERGVKMDGEWSDAHTPSVEKGSS